MHLPRKFVVVASCHHGRNKDTKTEQYSITQPASHSHAMPEYMCKPAGLSVCVFQTRYPGHLSRVLIPGWFWVQDRKTGKENGHGPGSGGVRNPDLTGTVWASMCRVQMGSRCEESPPTSLPQLSSGARWSKLTPECQTYSHSFYFYNIFLQPM